MEMGEILTECRRKQRVSGRDSVGVYLMFPAKLNSRQDKVRLFGRAGGPLGEILNYTAEGMVVALFPADKVIKAIHREVQRMVTEDPEAAWKALMDTAEEASRIEAMQQAERLAALRAETEEERAESPEDESL